MNHSITKTALTALIALLSLLNCFAQDTLLYRYMNPLMFRYIYPVEKPKPADSLSWYYEDRITSLYYINDSVFVIEGLFENLPVNSPYSYHFKTDKRGQWFMKYEADWKLFFNGIDDVKVGSWKIRGGWDMGFLWEKTTMTDGSDTIYILKEKPFYDRDNPKLDTLSNGTINHSYMELDGDLNTPYFTASSGIIACRSMYGIWIREDKMYLKSTLDSYRRLPR